MNPETVDVPCPHCRISSESSDLRARVWSCPNCGRTYVLRRCLSCSAISHVLVAQRRGETWTCVWCQSANSGYAGRNDPVAATIADLAADIAARGLAFEPPEHVPAALVRDT